MRRVLHEAFLHSPQFDDDIASAMDAAATGPVFILGKSGPTHVLLSHESYTKLKLRNAGIADLLAMPEAEDVILDITPSRSPARPADLS